MRCSNCDYNLIGNQSIFCPSCGAKTNDTAMQVAPQGQKAYIPSLNIPHNMVKIVGIALLAIIIAVGGFFVFRSFSGPGVGEVIEFGGIEWRVLDRQGRRVLVISEYILEQRVYHNRYANVNWADSDIRKYLNGEFLNRFTPEERRRIVETKVINNRNPWFGTSGGPDTTDYVFLLSIEEVVWYFGDSGQLREPNYINNFMGSLSDGYSSNRRAYTPDGTVSSWWLRSPGNRSSRAARVSGFGSIDITGFTVDPLDSGIRPALWLRL